MKLIDIGHEQKCYWLKKTKKMLSNLETEKLHEKKKKTIACKRKINEFF